MKNSITPAEARELLKQFDSPKESKLKQFAAGVIPGIASIGDLPALGYNAVQYGTEKLGQKITGNKDLKASYMPYHFHDLASQGVDQLFGSPQTQGEENARFGGNLLGSLISPQSTLPKTAQAAGNVLGNLNNIGGKIGAKLTGFKPEKYEEFVEAGITPTVADVTNSRPVKRFQNILSETPFAAGIIETAGNKRAAETLGKFDNILENSKTIREGGELVKEGAKKYNNKAKAIAKKLYNDAWKNIDPKTKIPLPQTLAFIDQKLTAITPHAREILQSSEAGKAFIQLKNAINANAGSLPFKDLKNVFRNEIDDLIDTWGQIGSKEQGTLKELRGVLDNEMKEFVLNVDPQAAKAFKRADKFWYNFSKSNKDINNKFIKNTNEISNFESVFNSLKRGDVKPTKTTMQRLSSGEKNELSSTFINELGRKGDEFLPDKCATNFNKLRPEARDVILSGLPKASRNKLESVFKAIENTKNTRLYGNPSGTEYSRNLMTTLLAPLRLAGAATGGVLSAKLMTSPRFIDAMYAASKVKSEKNARVVADKFADVFAKAQTFGQDNNDSGLSPEEAQELLQQYQ